MVLHFVTKFGICRLGKSERWGGAEKRFVRSAGGTQLSPAHEFDCEAVSVYGHVTYMDKSNFIYLQHLRSISDLST